MLINMAMNPRNVKMVLRGRVAKPQPLFGAIWGAMLCLVFLTPMESKANLPIERWLRELTPGNGCSGVFSAASRSAPRELRHYPELNLWVGKDPNNSTSTYLFRPVFFKPDSTLVAWRAMEVVSSAQSSDSRAPQVIDHGVISSFSTLIPRPRSGRPWSVLEHQPTAPDGSQVIFGFDSGDVTVTQFIPQIPIAGKARFQVLKWQGQVENSPSDSAPNVFGALRRVLKLSPMTSEMSETLPITPKGTVPELDRIHTNIFQWMQANPALHYEQNHGAGMVDLHLAQQRIESKGRTLSSEQKQSLAIALAITASPKARTHVKNALRELPGLGQNSDWVENQLRGTAINGDTISDSVTDICYHDLLRALQSLRKNGFSEEAKAAVDAMVRDLVPSQGSRP